MKSERLGDPLKLFIYGDGGVGKTTFAASMPRPIIIDANDGSGRLHVARYPFRDEPGGHVPHTYADVRGAINDLTNTKHDFRTVVFDTANDLEKLLWAHVIETDRNRGGKGHQTDLQSIEDYGWGKGYERALDEWRSLMGAIDRLRVPRLGMPGMHVVFLDHTRVRNFKNPEGPDFDRYMPAINEKAMIYLRGWSDITGFLGHEDFGAKDPEGGKSGRMKGQTTGRRLLRVVHHAAYDAKSRWTFPEGEIEIPADEPWSAVGQAIAAAEASIGTLAKQIEAHLSRVAFSPGRAKAAATLPEAVLSKDSDKLTRILNWLRDQPDAPTAAEET